MLSWTISLGDILMLGTIITAVILNWGDVRARLKAIETWIKDHRAKHDRFDETFEDLRLRTERHFARSNKQEGKVE